MQALKSLYLHILTCFVNPVHSRRNIPAVWKDDNFQLDIMAALHMASVSDRSMIGCFMRNRTISEPSDA